MQATIAAITELQVAAGIQETSLLNFVVSDGVTLVATRYASEGSQVGSIFTSSRVPSHSHYIKTVPGGWPPATPARAAR